MSKPLKSSHGVQCSLSEYLSRVSFADSGVHTSEKDRKAFGERVTLARLEFGARQRPPRSVTQTEIAEAMGVTKSTVGTWEAGKKVPDDLGTIQKLALVLGVRAAWLAWGEEPMRLGESSGPPPEQRNVRRG
jgi:transcriptional regulator with XRE-family HTH domain